MYSLPLGHIENKDTIILYARKQLLQVLRQLGLSIF